MIFWLKQPFPPEFLQVHLWPPDSLPPKKASFKRAYHYHWLWKLSPLTSINCAECTHWTVERPFIKFPRSSSSLPYHFCNKPLFSPLSDCQAQRFDLKGKIIHKWYIDVPPEDQRIWFFCKKISIWSLSSWPKDLWGMISYYTCFIWECSLPCIIS